MLLIAVYSRAKSLQEHLRVCNSTDSLLSLPETANSTSGNGLVLTAKEPNAIDELVSERDELVRENAALRQENQEMARLLKEYEKGMEATTSLIRDHAVYTLIPFPVEHSLLTSSHCLLTPSFPLNTDSSSTP